MRPHARQFTSARKRALASVLAAAFACVLACGGGANGASSSTVVTMDVPSATTLVTTGCAPDDPNRTAFGVVQPGTTAMTSLDCTVSWGSSNDSASLRLAQSDGLATAMAESTHGWTRHTGGSSRMHSVDSIPGTALALRTNGEVRRSTDNGATWSAPFASGTSVYATIAVGSNTTAFVSTNSTNVRRSTNINGGSPTFADTVTPPGMAQTRGIVAASANMVWVSGSGGAIRSTVDGGSNWTTHASPTTELLTGMFRLDNDSLVTWGENGTVVATSDGTTWRDISPTATRINDVWAFSDDVMVAITDERIYRTANATAGSPTWTTIDPKVPHFMRKLWFLDASNGFAFHHEGGMLVTTDGGVTWSHDDVDSSMTVEDVASPAAGTLLAVGAGNAIQRSTDSGATWAQSLAGWTTSWESVATALDGRTWRVGSDGRIERSTDGAVTWTPQASSTTEDLFGVAAFDGDRVVAVGREGEIVTSDDGGATWTVRTGATGADLYHVDVVDSGVAVAVGEDGTVVRSSDFGATWVVQSTTPGEMLTTVSVVSPTHAVASGVSGFATRTSNGSSWSSFALPSGSSTVSASAKLAGTQQIGLVAGGRFYVSSDGGGTWGDVSGPEGIYPMDLAWVDAQRLWATSRGLMLQSTDGGVSWTNDISAVTGHWGHGIHAFDASRVVVVGDGNLTGSTGTINPVADYQQGVSDWFDDGTEAFGVCLRATDATPTWTVNATCDQSADGAHWRGVGLTTGLGAEVANAASIAGTRSASFRFGLRVDPAQPPGTLSAGLSFVVLAPGT